MTQSAWPTAIELAACAIVCTPDEQNRLTVCAGTVTGSRFLVRHGSGTTLVDCGLFQGPKRNRLRNWQPFPVDPGEIDRVIEILREIAQA